MSIAVMVRILDAYRAFKAQTWIGLFHSLPPAMSFQQPFQLFLELPHILEIPIHAGKPDIRHRVQLRAYSFSLLDYRGRRAGDSLRVLGWRRPQSLRARLIVRGWQLPGGKPLCDDPRGSYRSQVVRVGAPGCVVAGRRNDQRR